MSKATPLPNEQRYETYKRQRGYAGLSPDPLDILTPKQLRRIRHKGNAALQNRPGSRVNRKLKRRFAKHTQDGNEWIGCPRCGATGSDPCRTFEGNPAKRDHAGRVR